MMRRVLLLGGTGFIGSRVLALLRRLPGVQVMLLAHRRVDYRNLEDVNLVVASLTDFDLSWIDVFEPDTVIHLARLAGGTPLRRRMASIRGYFANRRLVDKLRGTRPNTHVVYVSGTLVYGDAGEEPADETSPIIPTGYARQYIVAERPWMEAQERDHLPVTILRPPWVVGPASWLATHYVRPAVRDRYVPSYGEGANWMTFLDVEDCAGLVVRAAQHGRPGTTYNLLAPGQYARQSEFASFLAGRLSVPVRRISRREARSRFDRETVEALTTSLRARSKHESLVDGYRFLHPQWAGMVQRHLPA